MVRRTGARAGDHVIVTGTIGDAALGLRLRNQRGAAKQWRLDAAMQRHLLARYLVPEPRNALAEALRLHASAAMDVSDGLAGDLGKLCRASGVGAEIDVARVPLSAPAANLLARGIVGVEAIVSGGDDYEILCAIPQASLEAFRRAAQTRRCPGRGDRQDRRGFVRADVPEREGRGDCVTATVLQSFLRR